MADRTGPGYGTPNWEMLGRWMQLPPEADGPFWALNLMKYRAVADYGEAGGPAVSGREADDAYAPLGPLAAIGAQPVFHADVVDQPVGEPAWDRVGIVRYPSRSAFFAMQQRDDFKAQHVHKEAGMDCTIVLSCLPAGPPAAAGSGSLVLTVVREDAAAGGPGAPGAPATFDVEGVIVGDDRTWTTARFERAPDAAALAALGRTAEAAEAAFVLVLDPLLDRLAESLATAPTPGDTP